MRKLPGPAPSHRAVRVLTLVAVVATFLVLLWIILRVDHQEKALHQAGADQHELQVVNDKQDAALAEANRRLIKAGKDPVVGPPGAPGPEPTATQVLTAVATYCASTQACAGRGPTAAQVALAVSQYCNARGECVGPAGEATDGTDGADGTNGSDGTNGTNGLDGIPGPPPSDAQVSQAVVEYCANHDSCAGPPGPPGADGKDGQDGTITPGEYDCGEGFYVQGFSISADGTVSLECVEAFPPG